jgi:hypothetical protein
MKELLLTAAMVISVAVASVPVLGVMLISGVWP